MPRTLLFLVLTGALLWGACGNRTDSKEGDAVIVRDFRLVKLPSGERQVVGKLYNNTSHAIPAAQVQVSLFNADNVRVAMMEVTVRDIPASGYTNFKKPLTTKKDVSSARAQRVLVM